MKLNNIYKYIDSKYSPIIGYLSISPKGEMKELLFSIQARTGIMRDYFGFEFEENNTLTFYDFTSTKEKSVNVSIHEFIELLEPLLADYLSEYTNEKSDIKNILQKINL